MGVMMMTRIPFAEPVSNHPVRPADSGAAAVRECLSCPHCGSKSFEASPESRSFEEHNGATCLICGTFLTAEEARQRIDQTAADSGNA
jgi:hypothetical protein